MDQDFNKVIKALDNYKDKIRPSDRGLRQFLSKIPQKQVVTEYDEYRYNYSMSWKFILPLLIVAVVLVGFLYTKNTSRPVTSPSVNQVPGGPVTAQNADQTLTQTDQAVSDTINQVDQDLKALDQIDTSSDNVNNI